MKQFEVGKTYGAGDTARDAAALKSFITRLARG